MAAKAALQIAVTLSIFAALLFGAAGRLDWPMAWAFLALYLVFCLVGFAALPPALIEERSKLRGGTLSDLALGSVFVALLYPVTFVTCGLDRRFGWSPPLPILVQSLALLVFGAGYAFLLVSMRANPFFATVVRVQSERGHHVIDTGPYGVVRHPGYAGAIVAHLALPIALGSLWALIPSILGCLLVATRVVFEERTLVNQLDGYDAYRSRVRWRLLPGLW